jgi:hypothetical protein
MWFPLQMSSLGICHQTLWVTMKGPKLLTNVINIVNIQKDIMIKNHCQSLGKQFKLIYSVQFWFCGYLVDMVRVLIHSAFAAAYHSPPCPVPLWCWKITWCHSYRITVLDHDLLHDDKQPHFSAQVCASLKALFPGKWIGNVGPIIWPPRSPDVRTLDFNFWGFVKDVMYA